MGLDDCRPEAVQGKAKKVARLCLHPWNQSSAGLGILNLGGPQDLLQPVDCLITFQALLPQGLGDLLMKLDGFLITGNRSHTNSDIRIDAKTERADGDLCMCSMSEQLKAGARHGILDHADLNTDWLIGDETDNIADLCPCNPATPFKLGGGHPLRADKPYFRELLDLGA